MKSKDYFFIVFLLTIVITRLFLYFNPIASPTVEGFRLHHYMYGIVFVIIGVVIPNLIIYAIGLGLFVDELTYLLINGRTHEDNYSAISILGTILLSVLVFLIRDYLLIIFKKFIWNRNRNPSV